MFRKASFVLILSVVSVESSYASDPYTDIVNSIEKLCKAPSNMKSTQYHVSAKGKVNLRIKILGLAGADAVFKKQEWEGVQRVLREDQAKDNDSYRLCSRELTPIFMDKFYGGVNKKNKELQQKKQKQFKPKQTKQEQLKSKKHHDNRNQTTNGAKSHIINQPTGTMIFN